jgi:hypothetical protein
VDPESTKDLNFGLIDGGAVHFVHHRIWLPPWKHHEQRKKKQPTPDLAGEISYYPPGMTPNYGIEPTPSTTATPTNEKAVSFVFLVPRHCICRLQIIKCFVLDTDRKY